MGPATAWPDISVAAARESGQYYMMVIEYYMMVIDNNGHPYNTQTA